MKITKLKTDFNYSVRGDDETVTFDVACSDCSKPLTGQENFCPYCGRKLVKLPKKISQQEAIEAIGKALADRPPKADEITYANIAEPTANDKEATTHQVGCLHGNAGTKEHCAHRSPKGACVLAVCTSIPPQYQICPFVGSGFCVCNEA